MISRIALGDVTSRAMPMLLWLLFIVSQASAVVDFPELAATTQRQPWMPRALLALAIVATASLMGSQIARIVLYGRALVFLWPLPLRDRVLALGVAPTLLVASLPGGIVAMLLGPSRAVAVWALSALGVAAVMSRSAPLCAAALGGAAATASPVGALGASIPLALLGPTGAALRAGRPLHGPAERSSWWRGGPVGALIQRDLLALRRSFPLRMGSVIVGVFALTWWAQGALHATWTASSIGTGSVLWVGAFGWLPATTLGEVAKISGPAQLARGLPVSASTRVAALLGTAGLSTAPALGGVLLGGTANGFSGAMRVLVLAAAFSALSVSAALRAPTQEKREALVSHAVPASVFLTLFAGLGPWTTIPLGALTLGAIALAMRSLR